MNGNQAVINSIVQVVVALENTVASDSFTVTGNTLCIYFFYYLKL